MIEDRSTYMSLDQALTATAASTDYIDLTSAKNLGIGTDLFLVFSVSTTFTAAGAATLDMVLQGDPSSAAFGAAVTLHTFAQIAKATLVAGYTIVTPIPIFAAKQRYIRMNYTVGTGPYTAGALRAHITQTPQLYRAPISPYPA